MYGLFKITNMWNQDLYQKALYFAAEAHKKQKIKGTEQNYLAHLSHVSAELMAALIQNNNATINVDLCLCCALLHDSIEDTSITYLDIANQFSVEIADGVQALTKDERVEKVEQLNDSLKRIKQQPPEIHMVKLADRISNLRKPPENWSYEKRKAYLVDAQKILDTLGAANDVLSNRLTEKIAQYKTYLD